MQKGKRRGGWKSTFGWIDGDHQRIRDYSSEPGGVAEGDEGAGEGRVGGGKLARGLDGDKGAGLRGKKTTDEGHQDQQEAQPR